MSDTNARRYSTGAMVFHWVIAVLVIANWQIAERAEALDMPAKIEMFGYHKAVGIMILVLTLGRLLWRFTHPVPPLPATISGWEAALARTVHVVFYVLLIGLPLGGTVFLALIVLHVLGALKHTFVDRSGGIFRMLPFGRA